MKLQFLGDTIIRPPGVTILRVGNSVYKIPLTWVAFKEIRLEWQKIQEARQDEHFKKYVPEYVYYGFLKMPYLKKARLDDPRVIGYIAFKNTPKDRAHGDLFIDNMLVRDNGGRLQFIDWGRYGKAPEKFDSTNFYTLSYKPENMSWLDIENTSSPFVLHKISQELEVFSRRRTLDGRKVAKYVKFLRKLYE